MKFKIRTIVNWLSLAFFLIGAWALIFKFDWLIFVGYTLLAVVILLPRIIYRRLGLHEHFSNEMLDWLEIIFSISIILSVAGYLWLFTYLFSYDSYVHFLTPLFSMLIVAALIGGIVKDKNLNRVRKSDVILASLAIIVSLILIWELFEYLVEKYTNTEWFFTQPDEVNDTLYDVVSGFLSLPFASVIIFKYYDWFFDKVQIKKLKQ